MTWLLLQDRENGMPANVAGLVSSIASAVKVSSTEETGIDELKDAVRKKLLTA